MIIAYETDPNDIADAQVYRIFTDPMQRRRIAARRVAVGMLTALIAALFYLSAAKDNYEVAALVGFLAGIAAFSLRQVTERPEIQMQTLKSIREGGMNLAIGRREASIRPAGLHIATDECESLIKWGSIKKIEKSKELLFIFWSKNEIFTLPRRAFSDAAQEATFLQEIERHRQGVAAAPLVLYAAPTLQAGITAPTTESNAPWWTSQTPLSPEKPTINVNTHNSG